MLLQHISTSMNCMCELCCVLQSKKQVNGFRLFLHLKLIRTVMFIETIQGLL